MLGDRILSLSIVTRAPLTSVQHFKPLSNPLRKVHNDSYSCRWGYRAVKIMVFLSLHSVCVCVGGECDQMTP